MARFFVFKIIQFISLEENNLLVTKFSDKYALPFINISVNDILVMNFGKFYVN